MSKEAALAMATGEPQVPNPSLVNGAIKEPEPVKDLDSSRFAAQAKKEADFVKRQQAFKAEQEKFIQERTQVQEILKRRDQFEDTRKKDPVEALKLIGFNETEIFNFLAAHDKPAPTPEERAEQIATKTVEQRLAERDKQQADLQARANKERDDHLIGEYKSGLAQLVESNKEKFPLCNYFGASAVAQAMETVFQVAKDSKGEDIPTIEEAMEGMEEYYRNEFEGLQSAMTPKEKAEAKADESKKVPERSRTVSTPAGHTPVAPAIQKTRTLSNSARPTTASLEKRSNETREQKKERLMDALRRGKL